MSDFQPLIRIARYREWEGGFLDAAEDEIATERAKATPPGVDGETKEG